MDKELSRVVEVARKQKKACQWLLCTDHRLAIATGLRKQMTHLAHCWYTGRNASLIDLVTFNIQKSIGRSLN